MCTLLNLEVTYVYNWEMQPPFAHNNKQKLQEKIIKEKIKLPTYLTNDANNLLKGVSCLPLPRRLTVGRMFSLIVTYR